MKFNNIYFLKPATYFSKRTFNAVCSNSLNIKNIIFTNWIEN